MIALAVMTRRVIGSLATALHPAVRPGVIIALSSPCLGAAPLFEAAQIYPAAANNKPNCRIPGILQTPTGGRLILAETLTNGRDTISASR